MLKQTMTNWLSKTLVIFTALFAVQAMADDSPYGLMQKASDKLFNDIANSQSQIKQNPNYLRTIVRKDLMPYVHVNYAGSLVLGQYFKSTTPEQRTKFFAAFDQFIEQSYAQVLTLYKNQKIDIEKPKNVSDNQMSIRVKVMQNGNAQPINLTFFWRKNSRTGEWQVYDMAAEGVSMVNTKKQEWSATLRKDGIEALTQQVQKAANAPVTLGK
ncbi:phospholipid-binding protein MlaC [Avibacterium endocarditidis]|uniref:Phospholipid-binding protein MlaC n=1 Tax=Avibacterium endocarditidis TaxID=380674 RepID=A0ABX4ZSZ5_9PAST|nr:phospholipid-binding protein MlaC [Avibacterium endocarditidis]POY42139.1 phospholipid-binding protein MlaC [Avibacterium endocarditidis]